MNPVYVPKHRATETKGSGFTYGLSQRWVAFTDIPEGHRRVFAGLRSRYRGLSHKLATFFEALHTEDLKHREAHRRNIALMSDTITMSPVVDRPGRHRLREANQWPTVAQNP